MSLPFDVLLTTYDIALIDQDFLSQIPWQYAIIDEAQRLKNPSSVCFRYLEISLTYRAYFHALWVCLVIMTEFYALPVVL